MRQACGWPRRPALQLAHIPQQAPTRSRGCRRSRRRSGRPCRTTGRRTRGPLDAAADADAAAHISTHRHVGCVHRRRRRRWWWRRRRGWWRRSTRRWRRGWWRRRWGRRVVHLPERVRTSRDVDPSSTDGTADRLRLRSGHHHGAEHPADEDRGDCDEPGLAQVELLHVLSGRGRDTTLIVTVESDARGRTRVPAQSHHTDHDAGRFARSAPCVVGERCCHSVWAFSGPTTHALIRSGIRESASKLVIFVDL